MVIVGHMSSKSAFGAKNTGQKFLTPKNFWWCRNVCPDSCPGVIFGAGRGGAAPSFSGVGRGGRGRVENFWGRGGPGQPFPPGPGRGGACIPDNKSHGEYVGLWKKIISRQFDNNVGDLAFLGTWPVPDQLLWGLLNLEKQDEYQVIVI